MRPDPAYPLCYPCKETRRQADGILADLVVPITYRNGSDGQHSHDLRMYKKTPGSEAARNNLAALFLDFCMVHIPCVKRAAGIAAFSHVAFVPSTKRPGHPHPLQTLLAQTVRSLHRIELEVNTDIDPRSRKFHEDWFLLGEIPAPRSETDVLLIDDTWVTGARAQSAAHRIKQAGARTVVTVVLARQVDPAFRAARPLIDRITEEPFDPAVCAVHDSAGQEP